MSSQNALGMIQTSGVMGAEEAAAAIGKVANVTLVSRSQMGADFVVLMVRGDVEAVKTAIDAGSAAADRVGELLTSIHVVP
ncbi:BMC domain-containing protein [Desulfoluna sp.]|uniref:BMC domain-containing protein n=1 Tax=Desulfoluna sp. TaxID=2045199 RepID=UPI002615F0F8|nr:BMC domain-containing protein [Desulfoluna sp.]